MYIDRGLDNLCMLYAVHLDEPPSTVEGKVIAKHTNYVSCCKFFNSDNLVGIY